MITVVISAFNEEKNLPQTVNNVIRSAEVAGGVPLDVIIVNDGSRDGTKQTIEQLERTYPSVRSIHFEDNRGIGAGVLAAIEIAKYDKLCQFPGDNACSSFIMQSLFRNAHKADFLISYIVNVEERGYKRHSISALYSFIYLVTFKLPLKYVNGSPLYSVPLLKKLNLKSRRYGVLAEATIKTFKSGVTFIECPDYIRPHQTKTSALRWVNFKEVASTYLRLVYEIYFSQRSKYRGKSTRVLPPVDMDLPAPGYSGHQSHPADPARFEMSRAHSQDSINSIVLS